MERDSGRARVTGPIRCRKQGPGTPVPAAPPEIEVLPPTNPARFIPPPELRSIARSFAEGDYRACVAPIEVLYFARRNTFHQGLLQYVVAHLQLRLGLIRTPRKLLTQALALWEPYPDQQEGVDLGAARRHARRLLASLPSDRDRLDPDEPAPDVAPPALI